MKECIWSATRFVHIIPVKTDFSYTSSLCKFQQNTSNTITESPCTILFHKRRFIVSFDQKTASLTWSNDNVFLPTDQRDVVTDTMLLINGILVGY